MWVYMYWLGTAAWVSGEFRGDRAYLLLNDALILSFSKQFCVQSRRYLISNFMPVLCTLCSVSTRSITVHLQMRIADWLTLLISRVIMINKTADELDTNKGDFVTDYAALERVKSGLFNQDRVFKLLCKSHSNSWLSNLLWLNCSVKLQTSFFVNFRALLETM